MSSTSQPRIGVAGVGSLGYHHARIVSGLPGASMSDDIRPERAGEVATDLGVAVHAELDALLDRCDALVVAVPTSAHEEVATRALERGIPVMVEKPLAPDLASADRILAAGRAHGALVLTGHVERFNQAVLAAEPFLEEPLFVESHRMAPFTARSTDVAVVVH